MNERDVRIIKVGLTIAALGQALQIVALLAYYYTNR
jgi:hypothetical protein